MAAAPDTKVGTILTDASTYSAKMLALKTYDADMSEGKLLKIKVANEFILGYANSVEPHNDFYGKGEEWSESIRQDKPISRISNPSYGKNG